MVASKSDPIIIVGAGVFGLSAALRLCDAGYTDITVLEKDTAIPSQFSAANDLNKIIRVEYENPFYTELSLVCAGARHPLLLIFGKKGHVLT